MSANVCFEGKNGHGARVTRCPLMTQSGHRDGLHNMRGDGLRIPAVTTVASAPRGEGLLHPLLLICGSNSPPTWSMDGKVLNAGLLNWLRVELHKLHDLDRHTHFHRKAEPSRFAGGKRIIMCPISAR